MSRLNKQLTVIYAFNNSTIGKNDSFISIPYGRMSMRNHWLCMTFQDRIKLMLDFLFSPAIKTRHCLIKQKDQ